MNRITPEEVEFLKRTIKFNGWTNCFRMCKGCLLYRYVSHKVGYGSCTKTNALKAAKRVLREYEHYVVENILLGKTWN
jgi:hypothetical protein